MSFEKTPNDYLAMKSMFERSGHKFSAIERAFDEWEIRVREGNTEHFFIFERPIGYLKWFSSYHVMQPKPRLGRRNV